MKKFTLFFVLLVSLFLYGCNNTAETGKSASEKVDQTGTKETITEDQLHKEIMAVHDEIMPWDAELNRQLRAVKKELAKTDLSESIRKKLDSKKLFLETTHEAMMDWMASYASPKKLRPTKSHKEIMALLKKSQEGILKLKGAYDKVIEMAEKK